MIGLVLCGGKSTRMGSDKGLLQHRSLCWAQLAADKFRFLQLPVVLSVSDQQHAAYQAMLPGYQLVKDQSLAIGGPLKGLLSVHQQFPSDDVLVLACDMPSMQVGVLQHLLSVAEKSNGFAFVFKHNNVVEPLCGIYTAKGLQKLYQLYTQKLLTRFGLVHALEVLQAVYLPLLPSWEKSFYNYNSPADLSAL